MLKKSLLSLAVTASLVGMTGCNISSTTDNAGNTPQIQEDNAKNEAAQIAARGDALSPVFNPAAKQLPLGADFIFASAATTDGTADVGATGGNAVFEAINDLAGISTLAPIDFQISGSVDPATVIAGSTVHLVKLPNRADAAGLTMPTGLDYTSVDALDVASIAPIFDSSVVTTNLPLIYAMQPVAGTDYEVSVIDLDGGTDNYIRVSPKKPLDPRTKYIVVLTGSITDSTGEALIGSESYTYAAKVEGKDVFTSALAPVHDAIHAWEALASAVITAGGNAALLPKLAGGIVLSTAFTTDDPFTVLKSMAAPAYWGPDVITNTTVADALITAAGFDPENIADAQKIPLATGIAQTALTTPNTDLGGATAYSHPRTRSVELIKNVGGAGVHQIPVAALSSGAITDDVNISQGAIELPQYTVGLAEDAADQWEANTLVGAILDGALGQTAGTTPPSDVDGGKNVTYRFPFAQQKRTVVAPVMFFEPDGACVKPAEGWPVVIMQHGFQSERTGNLINGSKVAINTCHAVVAMDLPHHGIAANSSRLGLGVDYVAADPSTTPFAYAKKVAVDAAQAAVVADANSTALTDTILDSLAERHENIYLSAAGSVLPMNFTTFEGDSGSLWIRLDNFQRTRDNMRQGVMDLLNLNASLGAIDLDGDDAADLDTSNVSYVGHSLGAIVGTTFIAVNNSSTNTNLPEIQKAVLATPGGNLTKLIENSVALKDKVLGGLAAVGINQGDSALESYMKILQATIDSADPMNFIGQLAEGGVADTPTLVVGMYGNGTTNPADLVVPVNANGPVLADGSDQAETAKSPLVGLDPMLALLGAENVMNSPEGDKLVTKYNLGGHGTFSSAGTGASGSPSFDSAIAFGEMLTQTVTFLTSGAGSSANAASVLITDPQ